MVILEYCTLTVAKIIIGLSLQKYFLTKERTTKSNKIIAQGDFNATPCYTLKKQTITDILNYKTAT